MKICTFLLTVIGVFFVSSAQTAQAQHQHFLGYNTKQSVEEAMKVCKKSGGKWSEVMGFYQDALDNVYVCENKSQVVEEKNMYETIPVRSKLVFLGVAHNQIQFVNYVFRFKTWDARNQFKMSTLSSLRGIFYEVRRVDSYNYKIFFNEFLYLELVDDNSSTDYYTTNLFISRDNEGMDSYITGDVILQ